LPEEVVKNEALPIVKKPRGRPKRVEKKSVNEGEEKIVYKQRVTQAQVVDVWGDYLKKMPKFSENALNQLAARMWKNNPFLQNDRIKQVSSSPHSLDKKTLDEALRNPYNSEQPLREQSMYLYFSNYIYMMLLRLNREIPEYKHYILPRDFFEEDEKTYKTVLQEMKKLEDMLDALNVPFTFKTIATQVAQEGKCSYFPRISWDGKKVNYFSLQKIPSNHIKYTKFGSKQALVVSIDLAMFLNPINSLDFYPPRIREIWDELVGMGAIAPGAQMEKPGKALRQLVTLDPNHILEVDDKHWAYWVELDQDEAWTFCQDASHVAAIPETAGMFADFLELNNYRWLMGNLMSKGVDSILTAEIPLRTDANVGTDPTLPTADVVTLYNNMFAASVNANVYPYFGPFKNFKLHTVDTDPKIMDIVNNAIRDVIATSGNSALLTLTDKPSIAAIKTAQALAASKAEYLTKQFMAFLNRFLPPALELKNDYKIYLWSDIFNIEWFKVQKELLLAGNHSMLPLILSKYDQTIFEAKSAETLLKMMGLELRYLPGVGAVDTPTGVTVGSRGGIIGRPRKEDSEIDNDNTGDASDGGDNVSEIKT